MTASDVVVGAAAPAVKVRLASFALNGHVRLGLGAVIYLVEAEGRFVRTADLYAKCIEWQVSALLCRNVHGAAFVTLGFSCVHCDWYQCPH